VIRDRRNPEAALAALWVLWAGSAGARQAPADAAPEAALETLLDRCLTRVVEAPREGLDFAEAELARRGEIGELVLCRGYAREQLGRPAEAAADYQRAVETGERMGDRKLLAFALSLRGELAYYRGAFDAALADLNRAHAMERELGRDSRLRYLLNAIANVYADERVGAFDRALEYYRQLLALHEARGAEREVATAHFNLGSTYERKGELEAARRELERAVAIDRARGDADDVAGDERALAAVLVKLGRPREALARLDRVVARFAAGGDAESLAQARLTRAIARQAAGDPGGALADLAAARERFGAAGNHRYLARVEEAAAAAHAAAGDLAAALAARERQLAHERALAEVVRDEQTSLLRVQFDTERKERENVALTRENELRAAALADAERIRRLQRTVIALTAALAAVLLVLALRQLGRARRMQRLALTDELTRLPNRRSLLATAAERFAAARAAGAPLAVLALDIDHFKRINDVHGHETGDRVLQRVANAARQALRAGDAVGRVGGEEFLAVLPATGAAVAVEVAERLRGAVARLEVGDLAPALAVTVSVGVAALAAGDADLAALARRADEALYRAKQGGRDRVEVAAAE
jgi:diguanylate cyclase (GGDEF)-like protein